MNLVALQQQQLLRSNPLLSNMLNPALMAQFQMQQQMQLQQLQRILEAQKMFSKPQSPRMQHRAAPKNPRNQKPRKTNRAVQKEPVITDEEKPLPHRRILAINLPLNIQTIETVTGVFHPYGDVTVVRVLKPGKNLPQDVKPWLRKIPDLGRTCCAIVDFETARAAKFAVHVLRQRENEVGFRCGLLKVGIEEKLYEQKTACLPDKMKVSNEHASDSGITSEDQNSSASTRSTSASEQSDHSDSEIISSHTESDQEHGTKSDTRVGTVKYDRDFLLSFSFKNKRMPSGLVNLEHILAKQNGEDRENCASEPIRQPRGPLAGTSGFRLSRR